MSEFDLTTEMGVLRWMATQAERWDDDETVVYLAGCVRLRAVLDRWLTDYDDDEVVDRDDAYYLVRDMRDAVKGGTK